MILVKYSLENGYYTHMVVTGHAEYAEYGNDLICASVSSIMFGLMNCLDEYQDVTINVGENKIEIKMNVSLMK